MTKALTMKISENPKSKASLAGLETTLRLEGVVERPKITKERTSTRSSFRNEAWASSTPSELAQQEDNLSIHNCLLEESSR